MPVVHRAGTGAPIESGADPDPGVSSRKLDRRTSPLVLIALGILGMSLFPIAVRFPRPTSLDHDIVRGCWHGVCLALEFMGLIYLRKPKPEPVA